MTRFELSQLFDFAAAHRLHAPALSEQENERIYGKCHRPNHHGHNYRLRVVISAAYGDNDQPSAFRLSTLEQIVHDHVLERFDHRNLNVDTREFADVNPTVENIARVCHGLLVLPVAEAGGRLERVTVWETDKTSATYPAKTVAIPDD